MFRLIAVATILTITMIPSTTAFCTEQKDGRYQVQTHEVNGFKRVLRIDTETGKVWILNYLNQKTRGGEDIEQYYFYPLPIINTVDELLKFNTNFSESVNKLN